jgi:hypothetical protein
MPSTSLTEIGLLVMVNVLFISNYYFIKKLRTIVDKRSFEIENTFLKNIERTLTKNRFVLAFEGLRDGYRTGASSHHDSNDKAKRKYLDIQIVYGFLLGKHRMEPCIEREFPGWRHIPYKLSIISTSAALLLATFLLSDDLLTGRLAVSSEKESSGFCATDDFDDKIQAFKAHIRQNVTNYDAGKRQKEEVLKFSDALRKDTALYGLEKYPCARSIGGELRDYNGDALPDGIDYFTRESYNKEDDIVITKGPFFPGYCEAAREHVRINGCGKIEKEVCATFLWIDWKCESFTESVPCPAGWEGDYKNEDQSEEGETPELGSNANLQDLDQLNQSSAMLADRILKQIDIAGSLYSIYLCIALFFPTPIVLFRPSLAVRAKQLFFGAGKLTFMTTVLALYYAYVYLIPFLASPEVSIYLKNLMTDPCFLDGEFIANRTAVVKDICTNLINMENRWAVATVQIKQLIIEVDLFMGNCGCPFPGKYLHSEYLSQQITKGNEEYGFTEDWGVSIHPAVLVENLVDSNPSDFDVKYPSTAFDFLGDETICVDKNYARQEILVASDTGLSFWELWLSSGLLASLLVKFAIANFGIALLRYADPLCICNGRYESPPKAMNSNANNEEREEAETFLDVDESIKKDKIRALKAVALRQCLIWGIITNSSLVTLVVASLKTPLDEYRRLDYIIFAIIVTLCVVGPIGCFLCTRRAERFVEKKVIEDDEEVNNNAPPRAMTPSETPGKKKASGKKQKSTQ